MIKAKRGVGAVYPLTFAFYGRKHISMNHPDGCKRVQSTLSDKWVQSHWTLGPATLEINRERFVERNRLDEWGPNPRDECKGKKDPKESNA